MNPIIGTEGDDFLQGTAANDQIQGLGGDDYIVDVSFGDTVDGGDGVDEVEVDVSSATVAAGAGLFFINNDGVRVGNVTDPTIEITNTERISVDLFGSVSQSDTVDASGFTGEIGGVYPGTNFPKLPIVGAAFGLTAEQHYIGSNDPDVFDRVIFRFFDQSATATFDGGTAGDFEEIVQIFYFGSFSGVQDWDLVQTSADVVTVTLDGAAVSTATITNAGRIAIHGSNFLSTANFDATGVNVKLDLLGDAKNDTFVGGNNDDFINGGGGTDVATGGAGADEFVIYYGGPSNIIATDFSLEDKVSYNFFTFDQVENFDFIGQSAFTGRVSQVRYSFQGGSTVVEVDGDGDGDADFFATLSNGNFLLREDGTSRLEIDRAGGPTTVLGSLPGEFIAASLSAETFTIGAGAAVVGALAQLDGDTITDFAADNFLTIFNETFSFDDVRVTLGSAILDIDADQDGEYDATITLEGDFTDRDLVVENEDGNTTIRFVSHEICDTVDFLPDPNGLAIFEGGRLIAENFDPRMARGDSEFDTVRIDLDDFAAKLTNEKQILRLVKLLETDASEDTDAIYDDHSLGFVFARNPDGSIKDAVVFDDIVGEGNLTIERLEARGADLANSESGEVDTVCGHFETDIFA